MTIDRFKLVFTLLLLLSFIFVILTINYQREKTGGVTYQIAGKKSRLPQRPVHQHDVSSSRLWSNLLDQEKLPTADGDQGVNFSTSSPVRSIQDGGLKNVSFTTNDVHRLDSERSGRNIVTLSPLNYYAAKNLSLVKASSFSPVANVTSAFEAATLGTKGSSIYGKVVHGRGYTLLYNRVPKCGSRTFVNVAKMLAKHSHRVKGIPREVITSKMKSKIERKLRNNKDRKPNLYKAMLRERLSTVKVETLLHGHVYYVDFSDDETLKPDRRPLYFNLIRDPIKRFVSQYYFVRNGDGKFTNLRKLHKLFTGLTNETINECVLHSSPECVGTSAQGIITRYFCGYDPECEEPSEGALQKAKHNLERYVVVGVAEQYEDFLKVLEHLLPGYFKGMFNMYQKYAKSSEMIKFRAQGKTVPTAEVQDKLRSIMEIDYKFYNYTREKFNRLKLSLGIS